MKLPIKLKPEQQLQIQVHSWFVLKYPENRREFHHFANERRCSKLYGYTLELMGTKPGVSDIFIDVPRGEFRGLWIELKFGKNKPTEAQEMFLLRKREIGYSAIWTNSFDFVIDFIERYMKD